LLSYGPTSIGTYGESISRTCDEYIPVEPRLAVIAHGITNVDLPKMSISKRKKPMKEFAVVLVDHLNLRFQPGSAEKDIVGEVRKGDRLEVLGHESRPMVDWLKVRTPEGSAYIAGYNKQSGERFARIETALPDHAPPLDPRPIHRDTGNDLIWMLGGGATIIAVIIALYVWG
jgi:hypothetical protein